MGNWLKGRVLILPDQPGATTQQDGQIVATAPASSVSSSNASRHHNHHQNHHYYRQSQDDMTALSQPIYYPPYSSSLFAQYPSEEKQIQLAKRIGLIQHLPTGTYDGGGSNNNGEGGGGENENGNNGSDSGSTKNLRECVICMVEFSKGDSIRFLPCLHTYHVHCIDDWLMRSFICPSCMEPVDVALLNTL